MSILMLIVDVKCLNGTAHHGANMGCRSWVRASRRSFAAKLRLIGQSERGKAKAVKAYKYENGSFLSTYIIYVSLDPGLTFR